MNMVPQAYPLHAFHEGEWFQVIGWTDDAYWTDSIVGRLYPVAVAKDRGCHPQVLTGKVAYSEPLGCMCGS